MRLWIDIENPPQVQYLLPFRGAFARAGADTVVTARDYGATLELLERAGVRPYVAGERTGRGGVRKACAALRRAHDLHRFLRRDGVPGAVISASRASAVAARGLGIPAFIVGDYEHASVAAYRVCGSTILHPEAVDVRAFLDRGMRPDRLIAFRGLKEDITFAEVDVDSVPPHDLGPLPVDAPRVLFRPPSQTSHYYDGASGEMARAALEHLARQGAVVVYSPREAGQAAWLDGLPWAHPPVVLERPAPFVALLKSVDAVVCSGGTMVREAAYLGIPAYSIFCSEIGGVDRWLQSIGRATLIDGPDELHRIAPARRRGPLDRLDSNPDLLDELAWLILERARRGARPAPLAAAA